jgi:hypothetical protein
MCFCTYCLLLPCRRNEKISRPDIVYHTRSLTLTGLRPLPAFIAQFPFLIQFGFNISTNQLRSGGFDFFAFSS